MGGVLSGKSFDNFAIFFSDFTYIRLNLGVQS